MHVIAIVEANTPEIRKDVLSRVKRDQRFAVVEFYEKGDRKLHKKVEKYKKKHPRAVLKRFE